MRKERTALLQPELAAIVAGLGHGQTLVVLDAGMPIEAGPKRIDLAVRCGVPGFKDVLEAIAAELAVERVVIAREADERGRELRRMLDQTLGDIPITVVSHEELKGACASAVAVVRTGECTPYFNAILVAGVSF